MQGYLQTVDSIGEQLLTTDPIKSIPKGILLPPKIFESLLESSKKEYVGYLFSKINAIGAHYKINYKQWNDIEEEYTYMFEKITSLLSPYRFKNSVFEKIVANKFEYVHNNHAFWKDILNKIEKMYKDCNFGECIDYEDIVQSIQCFKIEDGEDSKKFFFSNNIN